MDKLKTWLILNRAPGIGPVKARQILKFFKKPENILNSTHQDRRQTGLFSKQALEYFARQDFSCIEPDLDLMKDKNTNIIYQGHKDYPKLLQEISDPPLILYLKGDDKLLAMPQIAIVGSRNPDNSGKDLSYKFARKLAENGFTVTSGLASGIDSAAHEGALAGKGFTIAVMGTGIDRVYPVKNTRLAEKILNTGLLVSEFLPGTPPEAKNFPRRNRIISGLSLGALVVQAALRSGSLITARLAAEQGREVFAIPGSIHNPLAHGPHFLIKQGAKLTEATDDIFEELAGFLKFIEDKPDAGHKRRSKKVGGLLRFIEYEPMLIDDLVAKSRLAMDKIMPELLELELKGNIEMLAGGKVQRIC